MATGVPPLSDISVSMASLEQLDRLWQSGEGKLDWRCLFSLPPWMSAWWRHWGTGRSLWLGVFRDDQGPMGVAPLMVENAEARLVGSGDLCDHLDVAVRPGHRARFAAVLLERLRADGLRVFHTGPVRADSAMAAGLDALTHRYPGAVWKRVEAHTREVRLPLDWEGYLHSLSGKERHEIRRKLRRLESVVPVRYRLQKSPAGLQRSMDDFIALFRANRADKAAFMTPGMAAYFRDLAEETAKAGLLRLYVMEVGGAPAAGVFCCDHQGTRHLYNNGYDDRFGPLSVGLMAKLHSLREAIGSAIRHYDFLKGDEAYKTRLGAVPHPIHRFRVDLTACG